MSVWCGRTGVPALSSHLHSFGRRRRRSLPFLLKHPTTATTLTKATALPPERNSETPPTSTISTTFPSTPTLQTLSPRQKDQISLYVSTLRQWNQRMNLTAVTEEREVMTRHVEDSLAILPPLQRSYLSHCSSSSSSSCDGLNLVDVGSGPGLPGLILAIACPSWKVTLLESMHKRCLFLEHVVDLTGLSNVQILRERAEWNHMDLLDNEQLLSV
ncbi:16S rRNA (Guanine527-N7)-methyltransferase [Cocos nucifera]|uniref:16S rRNA (Guanine527-N7)-methyltransferase n=1 Tax=Cocos nucifera TaxID=13894 RepID=A0A8K0HUR9_COCNU|nr:16S rRNA (Guanine527-N7)-methyltransferase [Cocos nucifera]